MGLKIIRRLVLPRIFKGFTTYGHGSHLGNVTKTIFINLCNSQGDLIGQAVSENMLKIMVIYIDIGPGQGQTIPWELFFLQKHKSSVSLL